MEQLQSRDSLFSRVLPLATNQFEDPAVNGAAHSPPSAQVSAFQSFGEKSYPNLTPPSPGLAPVQMNHSLPGKLGAVACTDGQQVFLGRGYNSLGPSLQQHVLKHEFNHIAQRSQQAVMPTRFMNGFAVNDNPALERAASAATVAYAPVQHSAMSYVSDAPVYQCIGPLGILVRILLGEAAHQGAEAVADTLEAQLQEIVDEHLREAVTQIIRRLRLMQFVGPLTPELARPLINFLLSHVPHLELDEEDRESISLALGGAATNVATELLFTELGQRALTSLDAVRDFLGADTIAFIERNYESLDNFLRVLGARRGRVRARHTFEHIATATSGARDAVESAGQQVSNLTSQTLRSRVQGNAIAALIPAAISGASTAYNADGTVPHRLSQGARSFGSEYLTSAIRGILGSVAAVGLGRLFSVESGTGSRGALALGLAAPLLGELMFRVGRSGLRRITGSSPSPSGRASEGQLEPPSGPGTGQFSPLLLPGLGGLPYRGFGLIPPTTLLLGLPFPLGGRPLALRGSLSSGIPRLLAPLPSEEQLFLLELVQHNNCLINAVAQAALGRNATLAELIAIRNRLGALGNMLVADPATIAVIREVLGIADTIVVHYAHGVPETFEGNEHVIQIRNIGAHFVEQGDARADEVMPMVLRLRRGEPQPVTGHTTTNNNGNGTQTILRTGASAATGESAFQRRLREASESHQRRQEAERRSREAPPMSEEELERIRQARLRRFERRDHTE